MVERQAKRQEIGSWEMLDQKRAIYRANSGPDKYREAHHNNAINLTIQRDIGANDLDAARIARWDQRRIFSTSYCYLKKQQIDVWDRCNFPSISLRRMG